MPELRDTPLCFVCGKDNPIGLHAAFAVDTVHRTITDPFTPRPEHEGWEGIVHGGVVSALLDEAMVKLAAHLGMRAVSAEMTVKFKSPAPSGSELLVRGRIVREANRLIEAEAIVERGPVIVAEATGKLLRT